MCKHTPKSQRAREKNGPDWTEEEKDRARRKRQSQKEKRNRDEIGKNWKTKEICKEGSSFREENC